jgi:hypothetical protein
MTMQVRISNETPGSSHAALVRVFSKAPPSEEGGQPVSIEDKSATRILAVGASVLIGIHSHRFVTVEELPPELQAQA